jgi:hypothetical protein
MVQKNGCTLRKLVKYESNIRSFCNKKKGQNYLLKAFKRGLVFAGVRFPRW